MGPLLKNFHQAKIYRQNFIVVPYLWSIMHMHFYCYLTGRSVYLLDRESEWCYSEMTTNLHNMDLNKRIN